MSTDSRAQQDALFLLGRPEFRRFLLTLIQRARIFSSAYGSEPHTLEYHEGCRSLGLDILREAARGLPVDDPEAALALLLIQVLREGAQPQERHDGRQSAARNERGDGDDFERR